jgi:chloramphenicol 3-O-phosphotransferase
MDDDPAVYLISGPMAAGKSTVARLLAQRHARGVHVEGDVFRRSIVAGREEMSPDPSPAALRQLTLRYRLGAAAADAYFAAGYTVAVEDVIAGDFLQACEAMIASRPCHVIVLFPSLESLAEREATREEKGYREWRVEEQYELFASGTPRIGRWLDTTDLTPAETVDSILARAGGGE